MITFRISKCIHIDDLDGTGARIYGGRWNSKGVPVVYTSSSISLATLETLVHLTVNTVPGDLCIAHIEIPSTVSYQELEMKKLPKGWYDFPAKFDLKQLGDNWIAENKYAVLKVPSAVTPKEYNYLINPRHKDAKHIKIRFSEPFHLDPRLM